MTVEATPAGAHFQQLFNDGALALATKLPHIPLYPGDWLRDSISGCSLTAQGLWLRMIFLAHDSTRYGYLELNGSPMPPEFIARRCGCDSLDQYESLLSELFANGVPSRNEAGIIYSRRMLRDENLRKVRGIAGSKGGKQSLNRSGYVYAAIRESDKAIKLGASGRPTKRSKELVRHLKGDTVVMLDYWHVKNMRRAEEYLHTVFSERAIGFEWFDLEKTQVSTIHNLLSDKGLLKTQSVRAKPAQNTDNDNDNEDDVFLMNFNKFWELMPKKSRKNKPRARESFSKALASTQLETILSAAEAYGKSDEGNGTYCRNASTWLNAEAWSDDQESWRDRHKPRNTTPEEDAEWTP